MRSWPSGRKINNWVQNDVTWSSNYGTEDEKLIWGTQKKYPVDYLKHITLECKIQIRGLCIMLFHKLGVRMTESILRQLCFMAKGSTLFCWRFCLSVLPPEQQSTCIVLEILHGRRPLKDLSESAVMINFEHLVQKLFWTGYHLRANLIVLRWCSSSFSFLWNDNWKAIKMYLIFFLHIWICWIFSN